MLNTPPHHQLVDGTLGDLNINSRPNYKEFSPSLIFWQNHRVYPVLGDLNAQMKLEFTLIFARLWQTLTLQSKVDEHCILNWLSKDTLCLFTCMTRWNVQPLLRSMLGTKILYWNGGLQTLLEWRQRQEGTAKTSPTNDFWQTTTFIITEFALH